jgi:hypothetical protein
MEDKERLEATFLAALAEEEGYSISEMTDIDIV